MRVLCKVIRGLLVVALAAVSIKLLLYGEGDSELKSAAVFLLFATAATARGGDCGRRC